MNRNRPRADGADAGAKKRRQTSARNCCVPCAVPTLPARPRLQPRGLAQTPSRAKRLCRALMELPARSARFTPPLRFGFGARAACSGGHPLPKGAGYPWPTDDQPHRARSLMHLHLNRTTGQTTHHQQTTPSLHEPRGVERPRRDALTGASRHRAPPRPALKTIQTIAREGPPNTHNTSVCVSNRAVNAAPPRRPPRE